MVIIISFLRVMKIKYDFNLTLYGGNLVRLNNIITNRLILVPMTYDMVSAVLNEQSRVIEELGFKANDKWPREDTLDILPIIEQKLRTHGETKGVDIWMIIKREDMTIIGDIGFKGEPDENGIIEIGYGLIEEERRKGYGYEAAKGLIQWVFSHDDVKTIKADCLKDNTGSIRILQKCCMHEVYRDNEMIYWVLNKVR